MDRKTELIEDIYFHGPEGNLECEVFSLQKLFRKGVGHLLTRPHRLHFYLVIFITAGEGHHAIDFNEYKYKKGDLLFIAPGQIQQFKAAPDSDGYLMLFTEAFLNKETTDVSFLHHSAIFDITNANSIISAQGKAFDDLELAIHRLVDEFNAPRDWASREMLRKLSSIFLLSCERLKCRENPTTPSSRSATDYYRFKQLVDHHFRVERSVDFYAGALAIPKKRLLTVTKTMTGQTPKEFIANRVVLEIKRLLMHAQLPIKAIAHELTFDEPTNLVKYFKKHTGVTPSVFKNIH